MESGEQGPIPKKSAGRRQSPEVRRDGLLQATVRSLVKFGAAGTSTRVIAEEAGVRQGLIAYYFPSKDHLIAEAYQYLSDDLLAASEQAVAAAGPDPRERLRAYLVTGFRGPFFEAGLLRARVALWSIAATNPHLHELHVRLYERFRSHLEMLIRPFLGAGPVDKRLVFAISALLDGLWLEQAAGKNDYDVDEMIDICLSLIEGYRSRPGQTVVAT